MMPTIYCNCLDALAPRKATALGMRRAVSTFVETLIQWFKPEGRNGRGAGVRRSHLRAADPSALAPCFSLDVVLNAPNRCFGVIQNQIRCARIPIVGEADATRIGHGDCPEFAHIRAVDVAA